MLWPLHVAVSKQHKNRFFKNNLQSFTDTNEFKSVRKTFIRGTVVKTPHRSHIFGVFEINFQTYP